MAFNAGDIETTLDLDRTPFNKGLDKAEADAKAFEKKRFNATINVNVDKAKAEQQLKDLDKNKKAQVKIDVKVDDKQLDEQLQKIEKNTATTADRSGSKFGRLLLNPIMIQLGLLPAAAAVAAAGVGAALALPVLGIAAWGIAATKSSAEVKGAFGSLKDQVTKDSQQLGQALQPALVGVAQEAKVAWTGLQPQFRAMFASAGPLVTQFSDGLIKLGINAIPGVQLALERGLPAAKGFNNFLGSVGTGLSDMFDNASRHADAAGQGLTLLGVTVQMLLGFVGNLIGIFSEAWATIGGPFNSALSQVLGIVTQFTSGALPALGGGFHGILILLNGIMTVLGPFANFFGSATGSILGAVAAYKLLSKATDGIGKGFSSAKTKVSELSKKFQESSLGMQVYGTSAKDAEEKTGKVASTSTKVSGALSKVGSTLSKVGNAIPIIGGAFVLLDSIMQEASKSDADYAEQIANTQQARRDRLEKQTSEVRDMATKTADATNFYNKSVQNLGTGSIDAAAAQQKLAQQTLADKDAQTRAAEATKTHTQRLLEYFDALTGGLNKQVAYNNSVKDLKDKQEALTAAVKEHGKGSMEAKFAGDELSLSMANQVKAAGDLALANASGKSEYDKLVDVQKATGLEAIKLIDIFGKQAPAALYQTVAGLSDTELAAIGGKRSFDDMGNAIVTVPGYKPIRIDSNMQQAAQEALTLKNRINEIPEGNHFFNYFVNTIVTGPGPGTAPFPIPGHASGTEYFRAPTGLTRMNEVGPEIAQLPTGSKIFTTGRSRLMVQEEVQKALSANSSLFGGEGDTYHIQINPPPLTDPDWLDQISADVSRRINTRSWSGK